MRPDKHKKRKNAAYKKKHGIQAKDSGKNENKTQQSKTSVTENPSNSLSQCDDENAIQQNYFSRRKIESNWDRYENERAADDSSDDDDDSTTNGLGENSNILLEKSGSQSSRFHFKNKREWEDRDEMVNGTPSSVNQNSLAEALETTPLQQRFDSDKKNYEGSNPSDRVSNKHSQGEKVWKHDTFNPTNAEQHKILSYSKPEPTSSDNKNITLVEDEYKSPVATETTELEELEDWLDSILD